MTKLGLFVAPIKIKCFSFDRYDQCWFYCFTLINKEELKDGIRVELQEPEFKLLRYSSVNC